MTIARNISIVGIHVAGPSTRKSAVVRTSVRMDSIKPARLNYTSELSPLYDFLSQNLKLSVSSTVDLKRTIYPPLFWEAFAPEVGAQASRDADSRILDVVTDLGQADIYCIDAPLSLPPLLSDSRIELELLMHEAERKNEYGKFSHSKSALAYMDRFFEYYARLHFNHPYISGHFEFEAVMGSGKAPLTARAIYLYQALKERFPNAIILESNAHVNLIGWALSVGFSFPRDVDYRFGREGRRLRLSLLKHIEQARYAARSASLHSDLLVELCHKPETFSAALSALSAWGLLNGHVYLTPEFLSVGDGSLTSGWACVPVDVAAVSWQDKQDNT